MSIHHLHVSICDNQILLECKVGRKSLQAVIPLPESTCFETFKDKVHEIYKSWENLLYISLSEYYFLILKAIGSEASLIEEKLLITNEMQKHISRGSSSGSVGGGAFTLTKTPMIPKYTELHNQRAARLAASI
jgi:hypothetical protein